jgi:hypothetical protein
MSIVKSLFFITVPVLLVCFLVAELFFRFVIPGAQLPWGYYDRSEHIARLEQGQAGLFTMGALATERARWRINNMGWNSDIDYTADVKREKPLIAVLGDSYVEAAMVDVNRSFVSLLRAKLQGQYDVYGFGRSGAPLSQYLQMSRYVRRHFKPAVIVVNVVHNDFDQSLTSVMNLPYFLGIDVHDGRLQESALTDEPVLIRPASRLAFSSATFRYLWNNLGYGGRLIELRFVRNEVKPPMPTGDRTAAEIGNHELEERAADYIIGKFTDENPDTELVFMIDGPRRDIYVHRQDDVSNVLWMNNLLKRLCDKYHCRLIDLTEAFRTKYERDGLKLSFEGDYHWNAEGHRYVADVLFNRLTQFGLVSAVASSGPQTVRESRVSTR